MDTASLQLLEIRRDGLIAEIRRLDEAKLARMTTVTTDPSRDPFAHKLDPELSQIIDQQAALIRQIEVVDSLVSAWVRVSVWETRSQPCRRIERP